ncbi:MAG: hypothetical protein ACYC8T_20280 [Myxococcaceae bacterium]
MRRNVKSSGGRRSTASRVSAALRPFAGGILPEMDPHRLAEERSIALHARIAELLREDPTLLQAARSRVEEWSRTGAVAERYIAGWRQLLSSPVEELCRSLVDRGEHARALRQATPFAGALGSRERWKIRRAVAERMKGTA